MTTENFKPEIATLSDEEKTLLSDTAMSQFMLQNEALAKHGLMDIIKSPNLIKIAAEMTVGEFVAASMVRLKLDTGVKLTSWLYGLGLGAFASYGIGFFASVPQPGWTSTLVCGGMAGGGGLTTVFLFGTAGQFQGVITFGSVGYGVGAFKGSGNWVPATW